jgi:hypothetical protein
VRFGEHLPGKQDQKYDGGGGQRPLGVSLKPLQPGFAVHAAQYRRCAERSLADLENQLVHRAVAASELPDAQRRALAGLLDVLWSPTTYERLVGAWHLENPEAVDAIQWLIAKVIVAVENNESPLR